MHVGGDRGEKRLPGVVQRVVFRADAPLAVSQAVNGRATRSRVLVGLAHRSVPDSSQEANLGP